MAEPKTIRAGDSISWTASYSDYPADDGWALDYVIITKDGGIKDISGAANGTDFDVVLSAAKTKNLTQGIFRLVGRVSKAVDQYTIYDSELRVEPNLFDDGVGTDVRTQAQRGLDAINAVIEGRASKDQENYSINGRSLSRTSIPDLIVLQKFYKSEVAKEKRALRISQGLKSRNRIYVRI